MAPGTSVAVVSLAAVLALLAAPGLAQQPRHEDGPLTPRRRGLAGEQQHASLVGQLSTILRKCVVRPDLCSDADMALR
jgi:hypothetical protein